MNGQIIFVMLVTVVVVATAGNSMELNGVCGKWNHSLPIMRLMFCANAVRSKVNRINRYDCAPRNRTNHKPCLPPARVPSYTHSLVSGTTNKQGDAINVANKIV